MTRGRPPLSVCGITTVQWATALGEPTRTSLQRALRIVRGRTPVPAEEVALVADRYRVDVGELVRALAALRGYRLADAPAGDPDEPAAPADG